MKIKIGSPACSRSLTKWVMADPTLLARVWNNYSLVTSLSCKMCVRLSTGAANGSHASADWKRNAKENFSPLRNRKIVIIFFKSDRVTHFYYKIMLMLTSFGEGRVAETTRRWWVVVLNLRIPVIRMLVITAKPYAIRFSTVPCDSKCQMNAN